MKNFGFAVLFIICTATISSFSSSAETSHEVTVQTAEVAAAPKALIYKKRWSIWGFGHYYVGAGYCPSSSKNDGSVYGAYPSCN